MATPTSKTLCFTCQKETRTFICEGCSQSFCRLDLTKHIQTLNEELDQIEYHHDQFREILLHQKEHPNKGTLIQEINQWKEESIKKIEQTANECRERLINYTNDYIIHLENQLNKLAEEIKKVRGENEFNEIDLNQFKEKLTKLEQNLRQPPNLLIKQQQQSMSFINSISLLIPPKKDTTWKQLASTIVGGYGDGKQLNQLSRPYGISIADDQILFIADFWNHRIMEWSCNATKGRIVAGEHGEGKQTNQLQWPADVSVDEENHSLIIADAGNRRVLQWSRQHSTEHGQILLSDIDCYGLTMDKKGSLYVSDYNKNEVKRWKRGETRGTIVAGGNGQGDRLHQLHHPTYVFVDADESLYVSDRDNHRVMKWRKDATEGIVVAGGNGHGQNCRELSDPEGVLVDPFGQIYVADSGNNRVMRWCEGAKEGTIVVGGNGKGKQANQLDRLSGLSFDCQGNLYVADAGNDRIQKFAVD